MPRLLTRTRQILILVLLLLPAVYSKKSDAAQQQSVQASNSALLEGGYWLITCLDFKTDACAGNI